MKRHLWLGLCIASVAAADEGMWTFDAFPASAVKKAYGFQPDAAWLEKVRLSSVRLAGGCSASFVSAQGLVMTNHHCVRACIQQLSTPANDLLGKGFLARTAEQERQCPATEANQLVEITDVTDRVKAATTGKQGPAYSKALKQTLTVLEQGCARAVTDRCDVVTLFQGARFHLYRYRRFQDVRLVFAPEFQMAAFGGYPDNFHFPRFGFDVAFLRVYENGKRIDSPHHFTWSKNGATEGELVFVSGHPGGTDRKMSVADLEAQRDVELPWTLLLLSEQRGLLRELLRHQPALEAEVQARLRSVENSHKAMIGRHQALSDPEFFAKRREEEAKLQELIRLRFDDWEATHGAFGQVARGLAAYREFRSEYRLLESGDAFNSELYGLALGLLRSARERQKPNAERLREFTDAAWPSLEQKLLASRPVSRPLEEALLINSLEKLREKLGADHPASVRILGKETPAQLARRVVYGTRLADAKVRRQLLEGGLSAVESSKDPMIELARRVDPLARVVRKRYDEQVGPLLQQGRERIGQAKIQAEGLGTYPDATFTLRLSYGQVKGWKASTGPVEPFTTFRGALEHATGKPPFALARSWVKGANQVRPETPLNLATNNDIIGGNSGSPLLNQQAEIVGLIFDGNLPSLGGRYFFDPENNRAVAVDSRGITAGLEQIYGAGRVVQELRGK